MVAYQHEVLAALGDPTRRAIFEALADGPRPVGELAAELPVSRPAVSQHLRVLKDAGLVRVRAEGTRRLYQLDPQGIGAVRAYFDRFWTQALASFKDVVEQPHEEHETMTMSTEAAVTTSVIVEAPRARAFEVFTQQMKAWWPPEHHILASELVDTVVEQHEGGAMYDVGADGSTCRWGTVLTFDPPSRFVFQWNVDLQWQVELDPTKTSEVEVRFVAEGPSTTRVELEHRHLDRHGEGWEAMRDAVGSADGWAVGLGRFTRFVASGSPV